MTVKLFSLLALFAVFFFPWPVPMLIALGVSVFEPLVPLAAGFLIDIVYLQGHGPAVPVFTLLGAAITAGAWFVRGRLKTGSIKG